MTLIFKYLKAQFDPQKNNEICTVSVKILNQEGL